MPTQGDLYGYIKRNQTDPHWFTCPDALRETLNDYSDPPYPRPGSYRYAEVWV